MSKGIDVSKHQGKIDWQQVKNSNIDFAMIRAGYGKYDNQKDEMFEQNYQGAKAAGIKVGAYHYSYAKTVEAAKEEAKIFLNWLNGKKFEYPVALDIEEKEQSDKGKQFVSDIIRAFCETVESKGYYVCVYANKNWLENFIDDDCKKRYDVWVAQWADNNTFQGSYGIWQYTSDGAVNGVSGRVDCNESYKDYSRIMTENALNGFEKVNSNEADQNLGEFSARMMISLEQVPLFVSATSQQPAAYKSGTFYIYDGKMINGRYRITNTPERAMKEPASQNVTGYVNKSDIR